MAAAHAAVCIPVPRPTTLPQRAAGADSPASAPLQAPPLLPTTPRSIPSGHLLSAVPAAANAHSLASGPSFTPVGSSDTFAPSWSPRPPAAQSATGVSCSCRRDATEARSCHCRLMPACRPTPHRPLTSCAGGRRRPPWVCAMARLRFHLLLLMLASAAAADAARTGAGPATTGDADSSGAAEQAGKAAASEKPPELALLCNSSGICEVSTGRALFAWQPAAETCLHSLLTLRAPLPPPSFPRSPAAPNG